MTFLSKIATFEIYLYKPSFWASMLNFPLDEWIFMKNMETVSQPKNIDRMLELDLKILGED